MVASPDQRSGAGVRVAGREDAQRLVEGVLATMTHLEKVLASETAQVRVGRLREGVTLRELVDGLNALGIGPRDMISILQAIKASGALQAEIEVM